MLWISVPPRGEKNTPPRSLSALRLQAFSQFNRSVLNPHRVQCPLTANQSIASTPRQIVHSLRSGYFVESGAQAGKSVRAWHDARHQTSAKSRNAKSNAIPMQQRRAIIQKIPPTRCESPAEEFDRYHRTHATHQRNHIGQGIPPRFANWGCTPAPILTI